MYLHWGLCVYRMCIKSSVQIDDGVSGRLSYSLSPVFWRHCNKLFPVFTWKMIFVYFERKECWHNLLNFAFKGMSVKLVGGKWDQRPAGWLPHWPVWGHSSLENSWWPFSHSNSETHWSPPSGDQCRPAAVSCRAQYLGLPQHQQERGGRGEAALGIPQLWPCARVPQLGSSERHWGQREGVSHVQDCGPLRTSLAWLRGRVLCRCRTTNSCFYTLWTRVLREVCKILVSDSVASWNSRISCCLPFLCHTAGWGTELHQINFPRASWLMPLTAIYNLINKLLWRFCH